MENTKTISFLMVLLFTGVPGDLCPAGIGRCGQIAFNANNQRLAHSWQCYFYNFVQVSGFNIVLNVR